MNKIYLPTVAPQDWQKLLADPEKQWRTGYSARTIAYAWEAAKGHFHRKSSVPFQRLVTRGSVIWKISWSSPNGRCTCRLQVTLLRMTCSAWRMGSRIW